MIFNIIFSTIVVSIVIWIAGLNKLLRKERLIYVALKTMSYAVTLNLIQFIVGTNPSGRVEIMGKFVVILVSYVFISSFLKDEVL